jgi:hypothetical protein
MLGIDYLEWLMSYAKSDTYSRRLDQAIETGVADADVPDGPRELIRASWRRSIDAGADPEGTGAPLVHDRDRLDDVRDSHPLKPVLRVISETLLRLTDDDANVMIVSDAEGTVLWRTGDHATMRAADEVGLADGHAWAESAVGTNGIGTALTVRRPVHVYAQEHLMRALHVWSCSSAPVIDPDTGSTFGCVDVSGTSPGLPPATVALVAAAARLAEAQLAIHMHQRDERLRRRYESLREADGILLSPTGRVIAGDPSGLLGDRIQLAGPGQRMILRDGQVVLLDPFSDGYLLRPASTPPVLGLAFLGEGPPTVTLGGRRLTLTLRHAELLALLALHPGGLTAEQLSFHVYGDSGNPVTVRAGIHRLRAQLGGTIGAKPYHLAAPVEADFLELKRLLAANEPASLARAYTGPLLPRSEAPELRRERDELEVQVRTCLLLHGSPEDLWTYAQTPSGRDDVQVLERLTAALPSTDPRAATARIRLRQDP